MLELRAVTCERGGRVLFGKLDCRVARGHLLRVKGANGSGKTSLLRMLCGLLPPAGGQILWHGKQLPAEVDDFGRQLVYQGHAAALKDDLSALENLHIACLLGGVSITAAEAAGALADAGLSARQRVPARQLSQGQRRRVALARLAMASEAPLWVLDEPFNALDSVATDWLCGLITRHLSRNGLIVLTSHQSIALDGLADQVVITL